MSCASVATLNTVLVPSSLQNLTLAQQAQVLASNVVLRNQVLTFYLNTVNRANGNNAGYCNLQAPWNTTYIVQSCQFVPMYLMLSDPQNGGLAQVIAIAQQFK